MFLHLIELVSRDSEAPNWGPTILAVTLGLTIVTTVLVLVRVIYRWRIVQLGWDDLCAVAALAFSIAHSYNDVKAVKDYGYGRHEADLPPDLRNDHKANLGFFISLIFTKPCLLFIRLAFCFLYLRIFGSISSRKRWTIRIVMIFITLYYISSFIVTVGFTCRPFKRSWNKKIPGTCINQLAFIYVNAAANIIIDLIVVALPIPVIYRMQRNRTEIAWGAAILALPSVLVSILRLPTLALAARSQKPGGDATWGVTKSTIWTVAELNVPIMANCLVTLAKPTISLLRPVLKRMPIFSSKLKSSGYNYSSDYAGNYVLSAKSKSGRRFSGSKAGWTRADDAENSCTVDAGAGVKDGSADGESLDPRTVVAMTGDNGSEDGILREDFKGGIMRTVDVDIRVSGERKRGK